MSLGIVGPFAAWVPQCPILPSQCSTPNSFQPSEPHPRAGGPCLGQAMQPKPREGLSPDLAQRDTTADAGGGVNATNRHGWSTSPKHQTQETTQNATTFTCGCSGVLELSVVTYCWESGRQPEACLVDSFFYDFFNEHFMKTNWSSIFGDFNFLMFMICLCCLMICLWYFYELFYIFLWFLWISTKSENQQKSKKKKKHKSFKNIHNFFIKISYFLWCFLWFFLRFAENRKKS